MINKNNQKGSIIYFALIVLTMIVGASLALTSILISQIRIVRGMQRSVVSFYAADTGIEEALYILMNEKVIPTNPVTKSLGIPSDDIKYTFIITVGGDECGPNYDHYCITSTGQHGNVQRAIQVGG